METSQVRSPEDRSRRDDRRDDGLTWLSRRRQDSTSGKDNAHLAILQPGWDIVSWPVPSLPAFHHWLVIGWLSRVCIVIQPASSNQDDTQPIRRIPLPAAYWPSKRGGVCQRLSSLVPHQQWGPPTGLPARLQKEERQCWRSSAFVVVCPLLVSWPSVGRSPTPQQNQST